MAVYKAGKYYQIRFSYGGKMYIKSSKTQNKALALELERKWREDLIKENELGEKKEISIKDAIQLYLDDKKGTANHKTLTSFQRYMERTYDTSKSILTWTSEYVRRMYMERKGSPATKKHFINYIRGTIKTAAALGYKTFKVEYPTTKVGKGRLRYLSIDEEKRLLKALQPTYEKFLEDQQSNYDFVLFLLDTGCRYSEACNIRWNDIDLQKKTVNIFRPKVGNESVLHLSDRLTATLKARFNRRGGTNPYVFTAKDDGPRKTSTVAIKKAFKRAGITGATVHTLRHTFASRMVQNGLSLYEVSRLLGHSSITTTMIYAHLEQTDVAEKAKRVMDGLNTGANLKLVGGVKDDEECRVEQKV